MRPEKDFWVLALGTVSLLILTVYLSVTSSGTWTIVAGIICFTMLILTLARRFEPRRPPPDLDAEAVRDDTTPDTIPFRPRMD